MDLRVKRTLSSIQHAFMTLRAKKALDKITVTELSNLAMINKATFYQHYQDIYDLSHQMEEALIADTVNAVKNPENLLRSPVETISEIIHAVKARSQEYRILFSDSRRMVLLQKLEAAFLEKLTQLYPHTFSNNENRIVFAFLVQGCFQTFYNHTELDSELLIQITGSLCETVLQNFHLTADDERDGIFVG